MASGSRPESPFVSPYVLLLFPPLLWATNAIVGRWAPELGISPIGLAFWRWILAFLLLLPFSWRSLIDDWDVIRRRWVLILFLGILSAGAYNTLLYMALATSTAINITLLGASLPIVMAVIARFWLGERLSPRKIGGIVLSALGVVLVVSRGEWAVLKGFQLHEGDLLMLAATLCWAVYSVLLRRHPPGLKPISMLAAQMAGGLTVLTPVFLLEMSGGASFPITPITLAVLGYTAIFPAILAFYFWNQGVAAVGPSIAGVYVNLVPIFTAFMAVGLLGEDFAWYHFLGLVLIMGGIFIVTGLPIGRILGRRFGGRSGEA
ncbi:MAG: DMT family transporter [Rhodospirillum sp.]|nr:DMT family transporter [Rhodospirillum sp.]MCF8488660.1 DMT family transporter [Rhodospirillum sp.]MCF8501735.1 DMT family transporter [Rhodospirillum sp.]